MSGRCDDCGAVFTELEWQTVGSSGPPSWAGATLYECPDCGNEQRDPRDGHTIL